MVKINWSVYILIGAALLFASYKIDQKKFTVFIWLGYVFLIVGVAKLGIWFINKKKESPAEMRNMPRQMHQPMQQQRMRELYCPRCRSYLQGHENFCPRCGQRVR